MINNIMPNNNIILRPNDLIDETFLFDIANQIFKYFNLLTNETDESYYQYCIAFSQDIKQIINLLVEEHS